MIRNESYIYKGRVPNFPWNRIANGRCYKDIVRAIFVIMLVAVIMTSCSDSRNHKEEQNTENSTVSTPAPVYEQPVCVPPTTDVHPQINEPVEELRKDETPVVEQQPVQPTITISKYYEKGYDAGYDDGEDDAVMENGWGGQFDDSCPYKGKARKEYQLGYEEGYEAGYYDNKDSDE